MPPATDVARLPTLPIAPPLFILAAQDKQIALGYGTQREGEFIHVLMTVNAAWNIWNFRRPLVEALLADGHRVSVLAPSDDASARLEALGCTMRPLAMDVKGLNPIEDMRLERRFAAAFRAQAPDIVLSYTIKNNVFGARPALAAGVPFVPNVTGLGTAFLSGKLLEQISVQLYRRAFGSLPRVFFQNAEDRDLFVAHRIVRDDQTKVLPGSGIDLVRFAPAPLQSADQAPIFLMVARLLRDKGVIEFVEAARIMKARHAAVRFQLLGALGPPNRTSIDAAMLEAWIDEGVIEYLGITDDVRPYLAAATCVVLPSYREGAPRTLIEAAAMSRPVIATDVPGCRDVIDRDKSGFLCEVRNAHSLALAFDRFLALPTEEHAAMGRAGRAKMVREFDQKIIIDAYRETIAALTDGRGVRTVTGRRPPDR